ncbi:kinase-like domain-containing protein [Blakeslea trispora]|nr:kinase-like domain-containing protein [Blakeslea trispora]
MQQVNGVPVLSSDPSLLYIGLEQEPTWFSAQGGVYKCIERSSQREVAIKKYLVEENQYEDMFVMPKELVENEIYSMTKCVHPNILKLFAVHLHEEFVYLVMPLYTGGSLQHYAFDHQLSLGQLVHVITCIVSGLAKVHSHGYIHRDMKCDNIFLDQKTNSIVIGDFGVVSISPVADSSIEEAGVVLFWSPELVLQKIVNHKIDIWALGIVILEMLNGGKAPYEDENLDEDQIKERILSIGKPTYPPHLPDQLIDLLDCCLDPDPRKRSSAQQLLQHPFLKAYPPELLFPTDSPTPQTVEPEKPFKCRLPIPSFSVDRTMAAATPVQEKIANVIRKRQSMTDTNRSQGSRIPMLSIPKPQPKLPVPPPARLSTLAQQQQQRSHQGARSLLQKPQLTRSNTVPTRIEQTYKQASQLRPPNSLRSPTRSIQPSSYLTTDRRERPRKPKEVKRELPPKFSIYRRRSPAGEPRPAETRTARLTMGVSTNARRQSYRQREEEEEILEMTPTLGRSARLLKPPKPRPQSFAPSHSTVNHSLIPESIKSSTVNKSRIRRQSVPAPSKTTDQRKKDSNDTSSNNHSSSSNSSSSSKDDANSLKNSIKALRVH